MMLYIEPKLLVSSVHISQGGLLRVCVAGRVHTHREGFVDGFCDVAGSCRVRPKLARHAFRFSSDKISAGPPFRSHASETQSPPRIDVSHSERSRRNFGFVVALRGLLKFLCSQRFNPNEPNTGRGGSTFLSQ